MIDLPIGTRFYFEDKSFEVVEAIVGKIRYCEDCFFNKNIFWGKYGEACGILECSKYLRKDRTYVCFREVKNE